VGSLVMQFGDSEQGGFCPTYVPPLDEGADSSDSNTVESPRAAASGCASSAKVKDAYERR
jgi:hypothetical protein